MSALWRAAPVPSRDAAPPVAAPMTTADIDAVWALETRAYPFPWTRGNFVDSLAAGYTARLLRSAADARLLGYFVAMAGVDEMHLLNITVTPEARRQGLARRMIEDLVEQCRVAGAGRLWLEVRESNAGARAAYKRLGFVEMGTRPAYYPAAHGRREGAIVMSLPVEDRAERA